MLGKGALNRGTESGKVHLLMGAGGRLRVPVVTARATVNQRPQRKPAVASQVVGCPIDMLVFCSGYGDVLRALYP